jgi:hypothetical protein
MYESHMAKAIVVTRTPQWSTLVLDRHF